MNSNKKISWRISILFVAFLSSFQFSYAEANNQPLRVLLSGKSKTPSLPLVENNRYNLHLKETLSEPAAEEQLPLVEFDEPGKSIIELVNPTDSTLTLVDLAAISDKFSGYLTKRGINIIGIESCAEIKAKGFCKFTISALPKASPSIHAEGEQFFIVYTDDQKTKLATEFLVKINYNDHLIFKQRNLRFDKKATTRLPRQNYNHQNDQMVNQSFTSSNYQPQKECYYQEPTTSKFLTIINHSQQTIDVTAVHLDEPRAGVSIGNYSQCKNLAGNSSCVVEIMVTHQEQDAVLPLRIVYNTEQQLDLIATAALVITQNHEDNRQMDPYTAIQGGIALSTYLNLQKLSFSALPNKLIGAAVRVGTAYSSTEFYNPLESNYIKPKKYDGSHLPNLMLEEGIKNLVSIYFKWSSFKKPKESLEYLPKYGCAVLSSIITKQLMDFILAHGNYLPEQNGINVSDFLRIDYLVERKKTISFAVKTLLRESCIGTVNWLFGIPNEEFVFNLLVNTGTLLRVGNAIDDIINAR